MEREPPSTFSGHDVSRDESSKPYHRNWGERIPDQRNTGRKKWIGPHLPRGKSPLPQNRQFDLAKKASRWLQGNPPSSLRPTFSSSSPYNRTSDSPIVNSPSVGSYRHGTTAAPRSYYCVNPTTPTTNQMASGPSSSSASKATALKSGSKNPTKSASTNGGVKSVLSLAATRNKEDIDSDSDTSSTSSDSGSDGDELDMDTLNARTEATLSKNRDTTSTKDRKPNGKHTTIVKAEIDAGSDYEKDASSDESDSSDDSDSSSDESDASNEKKALPTSKDSNPASVPKPAPRDSSSEPKPAKSSKLLPNGARKPAVDDWDPSSSEEDSSDDSSEDESENDKNNAQAPAQPNGKSAKKQTQANGEAESSDDSSAASSSDDDDDDDDDDEAVPQTPVEKDSDEEMADESMHIADRNGRSDVAPPQTMDGGFFLRKSVDDNQVSEFFRQANLEGKQVLMLKVPESTIVTARLVHEMVLQGSQSTSREPATFTIDGQSYSVRTDKASQKTSTPLLIPSADGTRYESAMRQIDLTLQLSKEAELTNTAPVEPRTQPKGPIPQPPGLRARYLPIGVYEHGSSPTASGDIEMAGTTPGWSVDATPEPKSKKKRKQPADADSEEPKSPKKKSKKQDTSMASSSQMAPPPPSAMKKTKHVDSISTPSQEITSTPSRTAKDATSPKKKGEKSKRVTATHEQSAGAVLTTPASSALAATASPETGLNGSTQTPKDKKKKTDKKEKRDKSTETPKTRTTPEDLTPSSQLQNDIMTAEQRTKRVRIAEPRAPSPELGSSDGTNMKRTPVPLPNIGYKNATPSSTQSPVPVPTPKSAKAKKQATPARSTNSTQRSSSIDGVRSASQDAAQRKQTPVPMPRIPGMN